MVVVLWFESFQKVVDRDPTEHTCVSECVL